MNVEPLEENFNVRRSSLFSWRLNKRILFALRVNLSFKWAFDLLEIWTVLQIFDILFNFVEIYRHLVESRVRFILKESVSFRKWKPNSYYLTRRSYSSSVAQPISWLKRGLVSSWSQFRFPKEGEFVIMPPRREHVALIRITLVHVVCRLLCELVGLPSAPSKGRGCRFLR